MTPANLREWLTILAGAALIARGLIVDPPDPVLIGMGMGLLGITPVVGGRGRSG